MKQKLVTAGSVSAIVALLILAAAYEYSMWSECRQTNSFLYCLRTLNP